MFKISGSKDWLFLSTLLSLALCLRAEFNVEKYCSQRCLRGQGGILCKCNAVHFNGKRSDFDSSRHTGNWILENLDREGSRRQGDLPEGQSSPIREIDMEGQSWRNYQTLMGEGKAYSHSLGRTNTLPFVLLDQPDKSINREEIDPLAWPESSRDFVSREVEDSELNESQNAVIRLRKALLQAMQGR